jgi:SnoaL-like domain
LPTPAHKGQAASLIQCVASARIDREGFRLVMQTVADGWNRGDARRAASCFGEDAIYSGPPSPPHRGREALYEFFGGAKGRELPMHMTWHNLVFDPAEQIGAGEYTFRYKEQTHGLVIVKMSNGLIVNWREYEVESGLPWGEFIGENQF